MCYLLAPADEDDDVASPAIGSTSLPPTPATDNASASPKSSVLREKRFASSVVGSSTSPKQARNGHSLHQSAGLGLNSSGLNGMVQQGFFFQT